MAHRVLITPEAEADLRSISGYIAEDSLERARRFVKKLRNVIASL